MGTNIPRKIPLLIMDGVAAVLVARPRGETNIPPYPGVSGSLVQKNGNNGPYLPGRGESIFVLGAQQPGATQESAQNGGSAYESTAGATEASVAVCLRGGPENSSPPMVCVEVAYPSAPGAGESIAIQEADTDADGFYITPTNAAYTISTFSANNTARADLSPTGGKFMRVLRTKGANAVGCTVKLTRLA